MRSQSRDMSFFNLIDSNSQIIYVYYVYRGTRLKGCKAIPRPGLLGIVFAGR